MCFFRDYIKVVSVFVCVFIDCAQKGVYLHVSEDGKVCVCVHTCWYIMFEMCMFCRLCTGCVRVHVFIDYAQYVFICACVSSKACKKKKRGA